MAGLQLGDKNGEQSSWSRLCCVTSGRCLNLPEPLGLSTWKTGTTSVSVCYDGPCKRTHSPRKLQEAHGRLQQEGFPKTHPNLPPTFAAPQGGRPPCPAPWPFPTVGSSSRAPQPCPLPCPTGRVGRAGREDSGRLTREARQTRGGQRHVGHGPCVLGGGTSRSLCTRALFFRKELLTAPPLGQGSSWGEGAVTSRPGLFCGGGTSLHVFSLFSNRPPILLSPPCF